MGEEKKTVEAKSHPLWNERDELQRLDSVAGVVAAASLAACLASAALIASGRLVDGANYALGTTGFVLLGCAVMATLSLAWSPLEAIEANQDLRDVVATKRSRTRVALAALVITVLLGFGTTAVIEVASHSDDGHAQQPGSAHQRGPEWALLGSNQWDGRRLEQLRPATRNHEEQTSRDVQSAGGIYEV